VSDHWLGQPERGSLILIRLLTWMTLRAGRPLTRWLLYPICAYFVLFSRGTRNVSRQYLERVLTRPVGRRDVFRHYHAFASTIHDRIYLLSGLHRYFDIRMEGAAVVQDAIQQKRGCILLGSHLGSFEVLRAHGLFVERLPISVVMHEAAASNLNRVLHDLHPEIRARIIPPGAPGTMLAVKERLDRGELVGILGDRTFRGEKTISCPFLGEPTLFPEGPFLLAGLLQVPVVLFFGLYQGGKRYTVHFELLADPIPFDRHHQSDTIRPWVVQYVSRLEHYCRLYPYNWFNFYALSPDTRPVGADPELVCAGQHRGQ
jgi:predicted LPLAT superfamily acyltransferase